MDATRQTRGQRFTRETKAFAIAAVYFAVSFSAILFHENAVLAAHGIEGRSYWSILPKALLLAKFMLVGDALKLGERIGSRTLVGELAWRSLALAALLIVLVLVEEITVGAWHGRSVAKSFADLGGGTAAQRWASMLLLLLILIPYVAARIVARELKARAAAAVSR
ncbi:hypothetical protein [Elioraea sp.]|uniref:hypothetical protein n=1 Tax=Elioraea sp. TaxID=2185103 RepID=UPI0025BB6D64|nr:hypothetical protein [Elioraea sp.]